MFDVSSIYAQLHATHRVGNNKWLTVYDGVILYNINSLKLSTVRD